MTAYLKRVTTPGYITSVRAGTKSNPLSITELKAAELTLIKRVQEREFFDEIDRLKTRKALKSSSRIIQLNPFLDEQGILRVGGRLKNSDIPQNTKHPIILPPGRLTLLLITKIHAENAHAGATFILAALRLKYWPLHAVSLVKRITRNCVSCRKRNANPCSQRMADLPAARVQAHSPPFTNTGIDYFGPIEVKQGRSNVKRYGVIFTCLSSRAVHLKVAHSLTTEAFLGVFSAS